jgi:transposase InsO family protein
MVAGAGVHEGFSRLARHEIRCSMSRKGNCWDNAVSDSFFASLKNELVYQQRYATRDEARQPQCHFGLSDIAQFDDFPDAYAAILFCGELADPLTHEILLWALNPYR